MMEFGVHMWVRQGSGRGAKMYFSVPVLRRFKLVIQYFESHWINSRIALIGINVPYTKNLVHISRDAIRVSSV